MNFTFDTDAGELDLLGDVRGVGLYLDCLENADEAEIFGYRYNVLSIDKLIDAKRTSGRPKDLIMLRELEAIREQRSSSENISASADEKKSNST